MTIVTREGKGTPLTHAEMDANLTELDTGKAPVASPTFTGTIQGDFSNATIASRVHLKTSTLNGGTHVQAIPNGSSANASVRAANAADPTNAAYTAMICNGTDSKVEAAAYGAGSALPLSLVAGSSTIKLNQGGTINLNPTSGAVVVNDATALGHTTSADVLQVGAETTLMQFGVASYLINNLYYDGATWRYAANGYGVLSYMTAGEFSIYTAPNGTLGSAATLTAVFKVFGDGSTSVKSTSLSKTIFGATATGVLHANGDVVTNHVVTLGTGVSTFHRDVSGGGAVGNNSAIQVGLHSSTNGDSLAVGGGPALLFFGYTNANPPAKAFMGRIAGYCENGASGNFYSGIQINVRADNSDSNASTVAARWTSSKNLIQEGYTQLGGSGAPAIKMKKLTLTTDSSEGGQTSVAHGLTGAKIIGFTCKVEYATNRGMPPGHTYYAEYQYDCFHDETNFYISLHATNSGGVLSKNAIILVTYEE